MVKKKGEKSQEERVEVSEPTPEGEVEKAAQGVEEEGVEPASEHTEEDYQLILGELNEMKDKYLRLGAEFDNFRKRTLREKQALVASAASQTLENLLPVVDDFERAIGCAKGSSSVEALTEGLALIEKNLRKFLADSGVEEIEAKGQELDTDFHEAITKIPAPEETLKGKIVDVVRKGYTLNGAVIRHAQVVIGE